MQHFNDSKVCRGRGAPSPMHKRSFSGHLYNYCIMEFLLDRSVQSINCCICSDVVRKRPSLPGCISCQKGGRSRECLSHEQLTRACTMTNLHAARTFPLRPQKKLHERLFRGRLLLCWKFQSVLITAGRGTLCPYTVRSNVPVPRTSPEPSGDGACALSGSRRASTHAPAALKQRQTIPATRE